jgi:hypothetical protein
LETQQWEEEDIERAGRVEEEEEKGTRDCGSQLKGRAL